jgi:hypothetical protein
MKQLIVGMALLGLAGPALAARWQVEVTNVTPGQTLTPILAATHYGNVTLFELGAPASAELATLAEAGDTAPMTAALQADGRVRSVQTVDGLLGPGESVSFTIDGRPGQRLSLAAMLIPTNDTFFAVEGAFLLPYSHSAVQAMAYDAGSEPNDQNCANIPGPRCGGSGASPAADPNDEGFVHIGSGFHDLGSSDAEGNEILSPAHYDWNNPVAIVKIRRVH